MTATRPGARKPRSSRSWASRWPDLLQKHGTEQDRIDHIDIADWLIRWHRTPNPRADATLAAVAQYFSPEVHEEIRALIHDRNLEFVGVERIELIHIL